MEFSREVRLDKRWAAIQRAAHVLSGEFSLPGWNVRSSIMHGPFIQDIRSSDFESDYLLVFLAASNLNRIQHASTRWYPLIAPGHHPSTAELLEMDIEMHDRLKMLEWLEDILYAPKSYWSRRPSIDTSSVVHDVNDYLNMELEGKKEVFFGTDAEVSSIPSISSTDMSRNWNEFLQEYVIVSQSESTTFIENFLRNIPKTLHRCPKVDKIGRPVDACEDFASMLIILVIIHENIVTVNEIKKYTGGTTCFSSGPATAFVHWWSQYAWIRFDQNHGRDRDLGLPYPHLLDYVRKWKGSLQITKFIAKYRAKLASAMCSNGHQVDRLTNDMRISPQDRVLIMVGKTRGAKLLSKFQLSTLVDWCMSLKITEQFKPVPLRVDRGLYDRGMMEIARRGIGNEFTISRSVRADIVPRILSTKPWVKDGVMSKIHGRYPVRLVCGGDVVKTEPITKTLFIYQVSSTWTSEEYPDAEQPLKMWVDGYRTRALALLIFEHVVCGEISMNGYKEVVNEFERGIALSGLSRRSRLQRILGNAQGRKMSQIIGMISDLKLSSHMEASVTREIIDLCFKSGFENPFGIGESSLNGSYLKLYNARSGEGIIQFDCMVNMAGLLCNWGPRIPYVFSPAGVVWRIHLYSVAEEERVHLGDRIEWNQSITSADVRKDMFMATNL